MTVPRMGGNYFRQIYSHESALATAAEISVRWCCVRGIKLAYEVLGHESGGIPIVMTPGGLHTREYLKPFAKELIERSGSRKLKILLWDRRNMGLSSIAFGKNCRLTRPNACCHCSRVVEHNTI